MRAIRFHLALLAALLSAPLIGGCAHADQPAPGVKVWNGATDVRILPRGRSKGWRTGGLSGLEWDPEAGALLAVSDRGQAFHIAIDGVGIAEHAARLGTPRGMRDAEALRRTPEGGWLVVYEEENAVAYYPGRPKNLARSPAWVRALGRGDGQEYNSGVESMALLDFGRLLLIAEAGPDGTSAAYMFDPGPDGKGAVTPRVYPKADAYSPVDAIATPNGDVLVLERRFHGLSPPFFSARLARIPARSLTTGRSDALIVEGRLQLTPTMQHENWEGLAIAPSETGPRLWLVSDDNMQWPQATLLGNLDLAEVMAAIAPR